MAEKHLSLVPRKKSIVVGHVETHDDNNDSLYESPHILHVKETTHAELFYDLFFVANLAVFTYIHSVNDERTLEQYICFICVLWFTWYQATLYDVRFAVDCVASRISKALHFGIMMCFAATGPMFKLGYKWDDQGRSVDQNLWPFTLVLMASRIVLVLQYVQTGFLIRDHIKTNKPMFLLIILYLGAAVIYGSLAVTFTQHARQAVAVPDPGMLPEWQLKAKSHHKGWIAWYVVGMMECILATVISCTWREIGYKGTHLIQRMSLLTLIILGEGVITLAKACQSIARITSLTWNTTNVVDLICAILILYFIYQLYFDWIQEEEHFGTIRQQVWAGLHMVLHLCLVLAVQGLGLCLLWGATVVEYHHFTNLAKPIEAAMAHNNSAAFTESVYAWSNWSHTIMRDEGINAKDMASVLASVNDNISIDSAMKYLTFGNESASKALELMLYTNFLAIWTMTGFNKRNMTEEGEQLLAGSINVAEWEFNGKRQAKIGKVGGMFRLTYIYFFVSLGIVVLVCALLASLSQREKKFYHKIRIAASLLIGLIICLLATIPVTKGHAFYNYIMSPWLLPSVTLLLGIIIVVNMVNPFWWHKLSTHHHCPHHNNNNNNNNREGIANVNEHHERRDIFEGYRF